MIKRLNRLVLGALVIMFCVVTMPINEVEAGRIECFGSHRHSREVGRAFCRGQFHNETDTKTFTTTRTGSYEVRLRNVPADIYRVIVSGACGAWRRRDDVVVRTGASWEIVRVRINY